MPRPRPALALALASLPTAACLTTRAAVGPHVTDRGEPGLSASGGVGLGWTVGERRAVYATVNAGVDHSDHARARLFESLSYVDYGLPVPMRFDLRGGIRFGRTRFDEAGQTVLGGAIGFLLWSKVTTHGGRSEKGWTDLGPDLIGVRGLGFEVAAEALLPDDAATRNEGMFTLAIVGDLGLMTDR